MSDKQKKVMLSRRLTQLTKMVTPGNKVADIGCDHAHTSIYLMQEGIANHVIAMDINQGPIQKAKENVAIYEQTEGIEIRLADGAKALKPKEADTILISGMGGALTVKILTESIEVVSRVKELVLQPQSEIHLVRHFLHDNHFSIVQEEALEEDGKYYTMIKAVPGTQRYENEVFYHYGKILLENKHPALKKFLQKEMMNKEAIHEKILWQQEASYSARTEERLIEVTNLLEKIYLALEFF